MGLFDARILAQNLIIGANDFALMAIPFFILVGELMNAGGIFQRIINFCLALVGHIRGGLGYVAIITAFIRHSDGFDSYHAHPDTCAHATDCQGRHRFWRYLYPQQRYWTVDTACWHSIFTNPVSRNCSGTLSLSRRLR